MTGLFQIKIVLICFLCIISASKISNKRICIYVDSEDTANTFIEKIGQLTVNNNTFKVRKLVAQSRRIILSNVHTCIPNSLILEALHEANIKTTSAIHDLHIGVSSSSISQADLDKYKHITSFRRAVYIEDSNDQTIPVSILINYESESYRIFLNQNEHLVCHLCKSTSHSSNQCPKIDENPILNNLHQSIPEIISQPIPVVEHEIPFEDKLNDARRVRDTNNEPTTSDKSQEQRTTLQESLEINMDTSTSQKRPHSNSSIATSTAQSQSNKTQKRNRKKHKPKDSGTEQNDLSSSPASSDDDSDELATTNHTEENAVIPLSETLAPVAPIFAEDNNNLPITFKDLVEFIEQCKKPKEAPKIVEEYTSDIPSLDQLLEQCHDLIKDRNLKNKLTRIRNALLPPQGKKKALIK